MDKKLNAYVYANEIADVLNECWHLLENLKPRLYEIGGIGLGDSICPVLYEAQNLVRKADMMAYSEVDEESLNDYLSEEMEELELQEES